MELQGQNGLLLGKFPFDPGDQEDFRDEVASAVDSPNQRVSFREADGTRNPFPKSIDLPGSTTLIGTGSLRINRTSEASWVLVATN